MYKFYFPFYYLFYSRLKTKIDQISWFIIFIIPPFLIAYVYSEINLLSYIVLFLLSQIVFNTLYEVGYIENDISTTKNEKTPTLRLDPKSAKYIKNNYLKIIYFRYIIVLISLGILYWINNYFDFKLNVFSFLVLLIINRVFFYWHNSVRNRWNLLTFSVLAITKYIFPIILFVHSDKLFYPCLFAIIVFPILRIIEHSTHKRYNFIKYAKLIGNHDKFRILYYGVFSILTLGLFIFSVIKKEDFLVIISIFIYFLIYRLSSYFLVKRGMYKRDDLKNKDLYVR